MKMADVTTCIYCNNTVRANNLLCDACYDSAIALDIVYVQEADINEDDEISSKLFTKKFFIADRTVFANIIHHKADNRNVLFALDKIAYKEVLDILVKSVDKYRKYLD